MRAEICEFSDSADTKLDSFREISNGFGSFQWFFKILKKSNSTISSDHITSPCNHVTKVGKSAITWDKNSKQLNIYFKIIIRCSHINVKVCLRNSEFLYWNSINEAPSCRDELTNKIIYMRTPKLWHICFKFQGHDARTQYC